MPVSNVPVNIMHSSDQRSYHGVVHHIFAQFIATAFLQPSKSDRVSALCIRRRGLAEPSCRAGTTTRRRGAVRSLPTEAVVGTGTTSSRRKSVRRYVGRNVPLFPVSSLSNVPMESPKTRRDVTCASVSTHAR